MADIVSVQELLSRDLSIPKYQRPYKWTTQSVDNLLNDIQEAIEKSEEFDDFKYRIGTVILNGKYIVDGQQRLITLTLLNLYLNNSFSNSITKKMRFESKVAQNNIHENYFYIKEWFAGKTENEKEAFLNAMDALLEIVVIDVEKISEAFQVFDSQNYRGKSLEPHDLLKAFHLREMKRSLENDPDVQTKMKTVVAKWEAISTNDIKSLFNKYMFPIYNWCRQKKTTTFTSKNIDVFKGIDEKSPYFYAQYVQNAMPYFQLTEQFVSGERFFELVKYYLYMLECVKKKVLDYECFPEIAHILNEEIKDNDIDKESSGFKYACNLFYCALLCYYDKFGNFNEFAVRKIFAWAFMLRVDMEHLGFDSVNKYAIGGEENDRYSNHVTLFSEIVNARLDRDFYKIKINILRPDDSAKVEKWNNLYQFIKKIWAK